MAEYELALAITGLNEGGYANNKNDKGKETFAGIARRYWPNWAGWAIIDLIKKSRGTDPATINKYAKLDPRIKPLIKAFYKQNFWDNLHLDEVEDQAVANTTYDFGVNHGIGGAAETLQLAYNEIKPANMKPLIKDGQIGPKTIAALNAVSPLSLYGAYNALRRSQYIEWAKAPGQGEFLHSWLSRLQPYGVNT